MNRLIGAVVLTAVIASATIAEVDPIMEAYDWAASSLEQIRVHEERRQNEIQKVVCEINDQSPCPTVTLAPTVITEP